MPKISAVLSINNGEDFRNQSVVLTGEEPIRVVDLLKMLAEILGLPESIEFAEGDYIGHYNRTPYACLTKFGRKYVAPFHINLSLGLMQLVDGVNVNGIFENE
jgi:UDP-glucose 4-epimerase